MRLGKEEKWRSVLGRGRERTPKPKRVLPAPRTVHKPLSGKAVTGNKAVPSNTMTVWQRADLKISGVHIISEQLQK